MLRRVPRRRGRHNGINGNSTGSVAGASTSWWWVVASTVTSAALAGRGASVALIDRGDFGNFTSQESSNLVWGGFKYLENYELLLVFKLCRRATG
jgi:hypothetical protein